MCGAWGRSADGDLCHAVWASADSVDRHPAQGLPCKTICRRKRTHSLASVLLTSKIKGLPSALACSLTIVSFQPIRVFAKKIDSIARDDSFLIGCVPAGGVIPKIFATIKLPIRACSSAAPTAISRGKCFFSVPSSNGLPVCGFTTNWQIIACGTPKPTRILTLLRRSGVATKDFRPLRPGFPDIAPVPFFLTRIKCACRARPEFCRENVGLRESIGRPDCAKRVVINAVGRVGDH